MTLIIAIALVLASFISVFLANRMIDTEIESTDYIAYVLVYWIVAGITFRIAKEMFGTVYLTWIVLIFLVSILGLRVYKQYKKFGSFFSMAVIALVLGGICFFSNTGYEVISTWSEKIERPIVQINGVYIEHEQTEIMGDCTFYHFYLEDDDGVLRLHTKSERVCDLRLTDGKARFEEIIHHDTVKHKYSGFVSQKNHADWTLYVPEG